MFYPIRPLIQIVIVLDHVEWRIESTAERWTATRSFKDGEIRAIIGHIKISSPSKALLPILAKR